MDEPSGSAPQDLLTPKERLLHTRGIWIRTWYGTEESDEESDEKYAHLVDRVFEPSEAEGCREDFEGVMFNSKEEFDSSEPPTPYTTPKWVVNALSHYPDILDGSSVHVDWSVLDEEHLAASTHVYVLVADKKACEEGYILHLSLNDKGQIIPPLVRTPALHAMDLVVCWMSNRQSLQELGEDYEGEMDYYGSNIKSGWAVYDGYTRTYHEENWSPGMAKVQEALRYL
jgi:hypothetical protein